MVARRVHRLFPDRLAAADSCGLSAAAAFARLLQIARVSVCARHIDDALCASPVRARMRRHAWRRARGNVVARRCSRITQCSSVTSRSTCGARPRRARRSMLSLAGQTTSAQANELGHWHATLPALAAGGPHELSVRTQSGQVQTVGDVLIGDVWLCSGQSNMVLQVHRSLDSRSEIANSANDRIRLLTVPDASSVAPSANVLAGCAVARRWAVDRAGVLRGVFLLCARVAEDGRRSDGSDRRGVGRVEDPDVDERSSAARGRRKQRRTRCARAVRGATRCSARTLGRDVGGLVAASHSRAPRGGAVGDRAGGRVAQGAARARTLGAMGRARARQLRRHGVVSHERDVVRPAGAAVGDAVIGFRRRDGSDVDQRPTDRRRTGEARRQIPRRSSGRVPGATIDCRAARCRPGENVIVVNVLDTYATGGLVGPAEQRAYVSPTARPCRSTTNGSTRSLPRTSTRRRVRRGIRCAAWAALYNGMIAPLGDLSIRGVAWYQGESNTTQSAHYQDLLTRFMADWRGRFGAEHAVPDRAAGELRHSLRPHLSRAVGQRCARRSAWPSRTTRMRVWRSRSISASATTFIRPTSRKSGRRLARAARHVVYGEHIAPSGPVRAQRAQRRNECRRDIRRRRRSLDCLRRGRSDRLRALCTRDAGSCRYARATDRWRTRLPRCSRSPQRRRACAIAGPTARSARCSTRRRLPAGPFQIEVQP